MKIAHFDVAIRLDETNFKTEDGQLAVAKFKLMNVVGVRSVSLADVGDLSDEIHHVHGYELPGDTNGKILGPRAE